MMDRHKLMIKILKKITPLHLKIMNKLYQLIKIPNNIILEMMDRHQLMIKMLYKITQLNL